MTGEKGRLWLFAALAILVVAVSFYSYWQKTTAGEAPPAPGETALNEKGPELIVYISGAVNHPGVIRIPAEARVLGAIEGAGGLLPVADIAKINMAQPLRDGMQIHVPAREQGKNGAGAEQSPKTGPVTEKININTASAGELDKLPGVGPAIAEKIVQYREAHGSFGKAEDLKKVPGIGESKYNKMKDQIRI